MAAVAFSRPPTIHEELERKAWNTLEWLAQGHQNGKLTEQQFSTGYDALFMAVSGLVVDDDFLNAITEAGNLANASKYVTKRHFRHRERDEILTFCWSPGEDKITTIRRVNGMAVSESVTYRDDSKAAALYMSGLRLLKLKGWIEL